MCVSYAPLIFRTKAPYSRSSIRPNEPIANALRYDHEIIVRDGLHCAPLAHQTLGTLAQGGSVRIGFSPYHTSQDLELLAHALDDVLR